MRRFLFICFLAGKFCSAQNVGINGTGSTPNASSMLDLNTGNTFTSPNGKGLLIPNVALTSTADATTVTSPATSLLVYNTATASSGSTAVSPGYYYWNGTKWVAMGGNGSLDWSLTGNAGTTAGTNFLGTTDAVDMVFKTNATEWMRILSSGNIGIGTTTPTTKLDIASNSTGGIRIYGPVNGVGGMLQVRDNDGAAASAFPGGAQIAIWPNGTGLGILRFAKSSVSQWEFIDRSTANSNAGRIFAVHDENGAGDIMTFLGSGNVGVGTTNPSARLHVVYSSANAATGTAALIIDNPSGGSQTSIQFRTNNAETGRIRSDVSNNLVLSTVGTGNLYFRSNTDATDLMFINGSTGRIGIGTINPGQELEVYSATAGSAAIRILDNSGGAAASVLPTVQFGINSSNGFVTSDAARIWAQSTGAGSADIRIGVYPSTTTGLLTIQGGGNVGIGCTSPQYKLHVVGNAGVVGTIFATAASVSSGVVACSDIRYKKNISPLTNSLDKILALKGVNYYWKVNEFPDKNFSNEKQIGFIAQDLEKIYPELVMTDANGYKSVDYSRLTPLLVEAIKELQAIISALKSDLAESQKKSDAVSKENQILKSELDAFKSDYESRLVKLESLLSAEAKK